MYNLIIADDEKNIREGLGKFIDWEDLGFKVAMKCDDGDCIIEYINTMSVDVVLCDIRMNKVSGLEVAKYIFENSMDIKVVLMSGYQEFEYAKKALEYNVVSYLVKPIEIDEIKNKFTKLKQEFDQRKNIKEELENNKKDSKQVSRVLLEEQAYLIDSFLKFDKDAIKETCKEIESKIFNISFESGLKFIENTLVLLMNNLEKGYTCLLIKEDLKNQINNISKAEDYDTIFSIFENCISLVVNEVEESNNSNVELVIKKANKYIQDNFTEDLTLEKVAEFVYLSPVYLSKIYKKNTGINFTDYVTKLKVERAKELLKNRHIKIYEISELVGYKNLKYFYKIFKNYTGYTPNKYREMLFSNKLE